MKKLLIAALTVLTLTTTAFATDANKVNQRVLNNFKQNFEDASDVEWSVKTGFTKASFSQGKKRCTAFYDNTGELFASSYNIELDNLPTHAKRVFAKKYADYTVKEAIQFDTLDNTSYFISAENDKQSVILKVADGFLTVFKRAAKN